MNVPRATLNSDRLSSRSRERGRVGLSIFAALARTARQVLPRLAKIKTTLPSTHADEDTAMHSPCL
jgi:hypothetical protein